MALGTPVALSTIGSGTDAATYAGTSGTPGNRELLIACVGGTQATTNVTTPTVINAPWGLTWTRDARGDNAFTIGGAVNRAGYIFYAATNAGTTYGADTFDVDFGGITHTGCTAIVLRISGAKLGNNGLDAIRQLIITADATTPYAAGPLSAAFHTANRPLAFYHVNTVTDIIHDSAGGWTEISTISQTPPTIQSAAHWNAGSFDTTPTATTGVNQVGGQWALEIEAALPGVPGLVMAPHRAP
jgi:hypothetical protein